MSARLKPVYLTWNPYLPTIQGPIVGKLYDTFGARYLIIGGTFFHVFGLMMASISTQYYQLLLSQGICSAIGAAAIFQPGNTFSLPSIHGGD